MILCFLSDGYNPLKPYKVPATLLKINLFTRIFQGLGKKCRSFIKDSVKHQRYSIFVKTKSNFYTYFRNKSLTIDVVSVAKCAPRQCYIFHSSFGN